MSTQLGSYDGSLLNDSKSTLTVVATDTVDTSDRSVRTALVYDAAFLSSFPHRLYREFEDPTEFSDKVEIASPLEWIHATDIATPEEHGVALERVMPYVSPMWPLTSDLMNTIVGVLKNIVYNTSLINLLKAYELVNVIDMRNSYSGREELEASERVTVVIGSSDSVGVRGVSSLSVS